MGQVLRPYQEQYRDGIVIGETNLIISTCRSGKTQIAQAIVDKYFDGKKVLILLSRRNILIQLASYFKDCTWLLSGKPYDETKSVCLGSFQTYQRRDVPLSNWDAIIIDEVHLFYKTAIVQEVLELPDCTVIGMTATPINNTNRFLGPFHKEMEFTNIRQMVQDGYLTDTTFISRMNLLSDGDIAVQKGDYVSADIDRKFSKEAVLEQVVKDTLKYDWITKHKTIVFLNSIASATKLLTLFNDPQVRVLHSKQGKKEEEEVTEWFKDTQFGMIINVRKLTVGFDDNTVDTVLYCSPTKIISNFLQSAFRASTIDPKRPDKVAKFVDYSGSLRAISPYFDSWKGKKPGCIEQCAEITDLVDKYFCILSCKGEAVSTVCTGEIPTAFSDSPYVKSYSIEAGSPCNQLHTIHEMSYETKVMPGTYGAIEKWTTCPCGCKTKLVLEVIAAPNEMVQLYSDKPDRPHGNSIVSIVHAQLRVIVSVMDNVDEKMYKVVTHKSSDDLYLDALKYFKGKPFTLSSNSNMKVANAHREDRLNALVPLVNWTEDNSNKGLPKKIVKLKLEEVAGSFGYKKGFAYYFMKGVKDADLKKLLLALSASDLTTTELARLNKKYNPDKDNVVYRPPTQTSVVTSSKTPATDIDYLWLCDDIPF